MDFELKGHCTSCSRMHVLSPRRLCVMCEYDKAVDAEAALKHALIHTADLQRSVNNLTDEVSELQEELSCLSSI